LVLAVVADSDPGAVYEQHRWLGAVVAVSVSCAYAAMMGWATLRHGGLPVPVLLMALVLAGAPFLLPRGLVAPAAALAVAGCAALATFGLRLPAAPEHSLNATAALTAAAVVLALGQAVLVGAVGSSPAPRAQVLAEGPMRADPPTSSRAAPGGRDADPAGPIKPPAAKKPVKAPAAATPTPTPEPIVLAEPEAPAPTPAPTATPPLDPADNAVEHVAPMKPAPPDPLDSAARDFVRDYYAALDAHDFASAWDMLLPDVQDTFGDFETWKQGYASTVSQATDGVRITVAGTSAIVGLTLRAGDRGACGKVAERSFAVTWWLARTDAGLRATAASARKISGPEPC
jgi:hypothetical protein